MFWIRGCLGAKTLLALLVIVKGLVNIPLSIHNAYSSRLTMDGFVSRPSNWQVQQSGWGGSMTSLNTNPRRIDVGEETMSKFGKVYHGIKGHPAHP